MYLQLEYLECFAFRASNCVTHHFSLADATGGGATFVSQLLRCWRILDGISWSLARLQHLQSVQVDFAMLLPRQWQTP